MREEEEKQEIQGRVCSPGTLGTNKAFIIDGHVIEAAVPFRRAARRVTLTVGEFRPPSELARWHWDSIQESAHGDAGSGNIKVSKKRLRGEQGTINMSTWVAFTFSFYKFCIVLDLSDSVFSLDAWGKVAFDRLKQDFCFCKSYA